MPKCNKVKTIEFGYRQKNLHFTHIFSKNNQIRKAGLNDGRFVLEKKRDVNGILSTVCFNQSWRSMGVIHCITNIFQVIG